MSTLVLIGKFSVSKSIKMHLNVNQEIYQVFVLILRTL